MAAPRSFWAGLFGRPPTPTKPEDLGVPSCYLETPMCKVDANGNLRVTNTSVYNIWVKEQGAKEGFQLIPVNEKHTQPAGKDVELKAVSASAAPSKPNTTLSKGPGSH